MSKSIRVRATARRLALPLLLAAVTTVALNCTHVQRSVVDESVSTTSPAVTQPLTATTMESAEAAFDHFIDQPGVGAVEYDNYDALVEACEQVIRDYLFKVSRVDYRNGVVTSEPTVAAQAFEVWRPDLSVSSATEATLATHRRTIVFRIVKEPSGRFAAVTKVVIERQSVTERRVTSVVLYRDTLGVRNEKRRDVPRGSRELDEGIILPRRYWFAVSRDEGLEKRLALSLSGRLVKETR